MNAKFILLTAALLAGNAAGSLCCEAFSAEPEQARGSKSMQSKSLKSPRAKDTLSPKLKPGLIPVTRNYTLPNGLRVVLSENHHSPTIAWVTIYDVGSRDEIIGETGLAHLFEHMMFEGSGNVKKGDYSHLIGGNGGKDNASTHDDFTNYWSILPSNCFELGLWLESDRMKSLNITSANLENQIQTVKEEKRKKIDNKPYGPSSIEMDALLFDKFANNHDSWGLFSDLDAITVKQAQKFFDGYYSPSNAVLVISGDINPEKTKLLIDKYFAGIPAHSKPPAPDDVEPEPKFLKYRKLEDKYAKVDAVRVGFKTPSRQDDDYYALGILNEILDCGNSGRLYQVLVKDKEAVLRFSTGLQSSRNTGVFKAFFLCKTGHSPAQVQELFFQELEKLKTTPVTTNELQKAKNQIKRGYFGSNIHFSLQTNLGRAQNLAEQALFFNDAQGLDKELARYDKVTSDDIMRVANKYLRKERSLILEILPQEKNGLAIEGSNESK
jgi:predicted Zn-dependent peptidase